jgi:hypothetical protein
MGGKFNGQFQLYTLRINCCIKWKSSNPLVTHGVPTVILMSWSGTLRLRCGFSVLHCNLNGFMWVIK